MLTIPPASYMVRHSFPSHKACQPYTTPTHYLRAQKHKILDSRPILAVRAVQITLPAVSINNQWKEAKSKHCCSGHPRPPVLSLPHSTNAPSPRGTVFSSNNRETKRCRAAPLAEKVSLQRSLPQNSRPDETWTKQLSCLGPGNQGTKKREEVTAPGLPGNRWHPLERETDWKTSPPVLLSQQSYELPAKLTPSPPVCAKPQLKWHRIHFHRRPLHYWAQRFCLKYKKRQLSSKMKII